MSHPPNNRAATYDELALTAAKYAPGPVVAGDFDRATPVIGMDLTYRDDACFLYLVSKVTPPNTVKGLIVYFYGPVGEQLLAALEPDPARLPDPCKIYQVEIDETEFARAKFVAALGVARRPKDGHILLRLAHTRIGGALRTDDPPSAHSDFLLRPGFAESLRLGLAETPFGQWAAFASEDPGTKGS